MKKTIKKLLFLIILTITVIFYSLSIYAQEQNTTATVLFTHDLHSHLLPSSNGNGGEFGGFARIMTAIKQQKEKYPDAILVDAGDFSMGSLFQTSFPTSALELRLMGAMGYDATTFGNHEYDYFSNSLASMLNSAVNSGDKLPVIVEANYLPPLEHEQGYDKFVSDAFENYGVKDYTIIERGGVYYAIFGIFGYESYEYSPNSGMVFYEPSTVAQDIVEKATNECMDKYGVEPVVVCLSHSGTSNRQGEDYELAQKVNGIDIIISGHTHTALSEPIVVNDTYIVSCGEYGKNLGVLSLNYDKNGAVSISDYNLIPINENIKDDEEIAMIIDSFKSTVESDYLSKYGFNFDDVIINNNFKFENIEQIEGTSHESPVCNIYSDAYKWAAERATGKNVDIALTAAGVVRESLPTGNVTVSDVFNAASLGVGTEGELVSVYVTGKDLKTILEVDASVQPLMSEAQLFCSGVEYSFNTKRMLFNKVDYAMLRKNDGSLEKIDDDKLYHLVTGMYCGQMLGAVESTSMGIVSIIPRDINGNPIEISDLHNYIIHDGKGNPIKEWYAIASYLKNMGDNIDSKYETTDGRKVVYSSLNPVKLLSNANKFTYIVIGVFVFLILIIFIIVRCVIKFIKKSKLKKTSLINQ